MEDAIEVKEKQAPHVIYWCEWCRKRGLTRLLGYERSKFERLAGTGVQNVHID